MSQKNNNPYAQAAGAYDQNAQKNSGSQREVEARVLLKSNRMLQDLQKNWDALGKNDLEDALKYNRQIWMLFYDTAIEGKGDDHTKDFRSNIVNLANFIFKREMEILSTPAKEKLNILISINHEIASGLMTNTGAAQNAAPKDSGSGTPSGSSTNITG